MTVTTRSGGCIQFGFCVYGKFPAIYAYGYYLCNCGGFGKGGAYPETETEESVTVSPKLTL